MWCALSSRRAARRRQPAMSLPGPSAPWRPALPLALPASPHAAVWPVAVPSQHRWLAEDLASASFLQTGDSDVVSSIFGRLSHAPTQRRAPSPQRDAMFDVNIVRGTLQAMLPLLPDRQPERGLAGGGRPQAPGRPGAPARPAGFDFDIMGMLNIIARALMMSSTLFKYATNPTCAAALAQAHVEQRQPRTCTCIPGPALPRVDGRPALDGCDLCLVAHPHTTTAAGTT